MYRHSLLAQEEIDRERTVVQQEIRRAFDQPGAWASELLARATFGDQPIGWPIAGSLETVEAMNRDDFRRFVFGNAHRFLTANNPDFFSGTALAEWKGLS